MGLEDTSHDGLKDHRDAALAFRGDGAFSPIFQGVVLVSVDRKNEIEIEIVPASALRLASNTRTWMGYWNTVVLEKEFFFPYLRPL